MKFTITISEAKWAALTKVARQQGFKDADAWLQYENDKKIQRALGHDLDLSPKEARDQLKLSKRQFEILSQQGAFPRLYHVNARVVRIPQGDIDSYKARRARLMPESKVA